MQHWLRFRYQDNTAFGTLRNGTIEVHRGSMFDQPRPSGETLPLRSVSLLPPCDPSKMIGLWNNFHARAAKEGLQRPDHPLYFLKSPNSFGAHDDAILRPPGYSGPVAFEGELGVVIGRECHNLGEAEAAECIFGYTCVNDVTARGIMKADPSFTQWTRAKGFDTFGPFGPVICSGIASRDLRVRTRVDGEEKQNYPVSDMFFSPEQLVSHISRDMTLFPGDVIACGTSVGAEAMPDGCTVEVEIEPIGRLRNRFQPI